MGAVRHGDYIAKVRVAPARELADRVVQRALDPSAGDQVFRPALVAELRERPYEFDIQVQLCTDLVEMPIEDLTITTATTKIERTDSHGDSSTEWNAGPCGACAASA